MSNLTITDETALFIVSCSAAIHQQLYTLIDLLNEHERNHQGLDGHRIPVPVHDRQTASRSPVRCRSRLGKTLNFYYREAG